MEQLQIVESKSEKQDVKIAFITGITGQDGSYRAELLLEKDYKVYGMIRRSSSINTGRIDHIFLNPNLKLVYGDLTDSTNITHILANIKSKHPNMTRLEVYNLGAQSHVLISFELPEYTAQVDALGTLKLLESIRSNGLESVTRFYQASTSELFGLSKGKKFNEETEMYPRSPYSCAKLYAYWIVKNYREAYNMFACSGILFNHESERRGHNFVTRKITISLGKILRGESDRLILGNLDARRDWSHALDHVEGMWRILQHYTPIDYVLSSNECHTVREFIEKAFKLRGFDIKWKGEGISEIGYDLITGRELIFIDSKYFRPSEVERLLGDSTKARTELDWKPKISFDELVKRMVDTDCP